MPRPTARLNASRVSVVGLILLFVLVVLIRAPSDAPLPTNTAETAAVGEQTESTAGVDGDSPPQALGGTVAGTPAETEEPPLATGCFGSGSTRAEVSSVMGAPDSIVFGEWVYGRSGVTFGYGTVLDYSNEGGNLRLC